MQKRALQQVQGFMQMALTIESYKLADLTC